MDPVAELQRTLDEADKGGYGVGAWYFYMDRRHLEAVMAETLSLRQQVAGLTAGMTLMEERLQAPPTF